MLYDLCHIAAHRIVNMVLRKRAVSGNVASGEETTKLIWWPSIVIKQRMLSTAFSLLPSAFRTARAFCVVSANMCVCVCVCGCVRASRIPFGDHPIQDGTIQSNISCPLRKDNTHNSGSVHFLACSVQVSRYAGKRHVFRNATLWTQRPRHLRASGYDVSLTH